jgi:hypothetical protein
VALFLSLSVAIFMTPVPTCAQQWSGILSPSRATDWSGAGIPGGIPSSNWTQCGPTVAAYSGSAATINTALAACGSNQFVSLGNGTFNLSSAINFGGKSSVVLRGQGANSTFLVFSGSGSCLGFSVVVCIELNSGVQGLAAPCGGAPPCSGPTTNWTGGYAVGSTQLTVGSTSGFSNGMVLYLDQLDDTSDGFPAPGDMTVCGTSPSFCLTTNGGEDYTRTILGNVGNRGQQEQTIITQIVDSSHLAISPSIRLPNWRASQSPAAFAGTTVVVNDGLENLSVDATNAGGITGCNGCGIIMLAGARASWVRGVRVVNASTRNHVWLYQCNHCVVRDSYFYGSTNNAASTSYGIELANASDSLVENNIFQHETAPLMLNGAEVGDVMSYNFCIDDNYTAGGSAPGWMQPCITLHNAGQAMLLIEGNSGPGTNADMVHGTHHFLTQFRNYWYGDIWNNPAKSGNTTPLHLEAWARFANVVGNVLGRSGYYNSYQTNLDSTGKEIYSLGEPDNSPKNDPRVLATLMRWGNYDTVNGAARFVSSEVPTGITNFANLLPPSQVLPASFYLTSKPSFFGSIPWPAVGPDVSGGNEANVGGHAYMNPAEACWQNVMKGVVGSSGLLSFNADTCYGSGGSSTGTPPQPPTNLKAIAQ